MAGDAKLRRWDNARGVRLHEREEMLARQLLAKHDLALHCCSVQLKDLLCQIDGKQPVGTALARLAGIWGD